MPFKRRRLSFENQSPPNKIPGVSEVPSVPKDCKAFEQPLQLLRQRTAPKKRYGRETEGRVTCHEPNCKLSKNTGQKSPRKLLNFASTPSRRSPTGPPTAPGHMPVQHYPGCVLLPVEESLQQPSAPLRSPAPAPAREDGLRAGLCLGSRGEGRSVHPSPAARQPAGFGTCIRGCCLTRWPQATTNSSEKVKRHVVTLLQIYFRVN